MLQSDLANADNLSQEIARIQQALVLLGLPSPVIVVEIENPPATPVRLTITPSITNLTTMLNNRVANLQAQLVALGVTLT